MAENEYYTKRKKKFRRLTFDIPKPLYQLFRRSKFRKAAQTDSEGMRRLLSHALNESE